MAEIVGWSDDHEQLLRLQRAKVAAGGIRALTAATLVLPGETVPTDFGPEDAEETRALTTYNPQLLRGGVASWIGSPDGMFRQTLVLPGEKAPEFYSKMFVPHRKQNFRSNAVQMLMPKTPQGGINYDAGVNFSTLETPYTNPRGPFMSRHMHDATHHRVLVGARHMDAMIDGAASYGFNQRMFGCPIPSYAQVTARDVSNKRQRVNAHLAHVKSMKGIFSPATLNHVQNTENAFMTSLTDKVDAKMSSDVVQQLSGAVPGVDASRAEAIVKGLQNEYTQRFGAMVPNTASPFAIYKSEVWHPEAHGIDSTEGYAFGGVDPSKIDYTSKGTRLFGKGLAVRYGDGKKHVFANVYTTMVPAGQPVSTVPFSSTWYPHEEGSDAYIMQPAGAPQYSGVTFSTPISGSSGLAFLSV